MVNCILQNWDKSLAGLTVRWDGQVVERVESETVLLVWKPVSTVPACVPVRVYFNETPISHIAYFTYTEEEGNWFFQFKSFKQKNALHSWHLFQQTTLENIVAII